MAEAFQCDLCKRLEEGKPLAVLETRGTDPDRPNLSLRQDACTLCLASFKDWQAGREALAPQDGPRAT